MAPRVAPRTHSPRVPRVREIAISEFKTHCLRLIGEVMKTQGEIVITRRGKPVARVSGIKPRSGKIMGSRQGMGREVGDIVHNDWSQLFNVLREDGEDQT
ncbi:MAG: type II toxin-antitoxin system Phd/YefM family antitoxin [Myxococcales bacterium]|nr:type II toxin-antitoxin system Phd/YefM family antitoxin [Myxococcales bacterium]